MKVRFRAQAIGDLEEIHSYLDPRSPAGARNVLRAIYTAIDEITLFPNATTKTSDPAIRVKILGRYRYKIFYRVIDGDTIDILHVRHVARRPWP